MVHQDMTHVVYINIVLRDMTQNGLQYDLENTKEKPVHKPSQDQSKSSALGGAWNFVEWCHGFQHYCYFRVQDIFLHNRGHGFVNISLVNASEGKLGMHITQPKFLFLFKITNGLKTRSRLVKLGLNQYFCACTKPCWIDNSSLRQNKRSCVQLLTDTFPYNFF